MNLYVGNLSPETTEAGLRGMFSEFGEVVSVKILIDAATGLPRGFGFVEMADKFEGFDCIDNIDQTFYDGNIISVREAKGNKPSGSGGPRGGGNRFGGGGGNRFGSGGGGNRFGSGGSSSSSGSGRQRTPRKPGSGGDFNSNSGGGGFNKY